MVLQLRRQLGAADAGSLLLPRTLHGTSVCDVAASANSIAAEGLDALKLLRRGVKRKHEGRDWKAADFGHVTFSGYSGGNPLSKLKHVATPDADDQRG